MTDNVGAVSVDANRSATFQLVAKDIRLETREGLPIVESVSLKLRPGEVYGLVGESGSGKTTLALALMGHVQPGVRWATGELSVEGVTIDAGTKGSRSYRQLTYIPQNPGTALDPSMRVGRQIKNVARAHGVADEQGDVVAQALASVGLPADRAFIRRFPHELSGGQQQRVCTAAALACEPTILVLDEPTTGLDVITQAKVLEELRRLGRERNVTMIYVTHDLAVVAQIADRIAVMYAGQIVEEGTAKEVLSRPRHPYTHGLLAAIPDHATRNSLQSMPGGAVGLEGRPQGCTFAPRCALQDERCTEQRPDIHILDEGHSVRCLKWQHVGELTGARDRMPDRALTDAPAFLDVRDLSAGYSNGRIKSVVASDVSFSIRPGECVALLGESGSGKSTIARTIAGLHPLDGGEMLLEGRALGPASRRTMDQRKKVQIVFQNPMDALNPRHTVGTSLVRAVRFFEGASRRAARDEVAPLLDMVRLPASLARRYPSELSGGEAQRVCLARAIAGNPELIVCDEITSSLDVSSQAAVLELLEQLRRDRGLSLLFITHDVGVVSAVADQVIVLHKGRISERGPTRRLLEDPTNGYTRDLIAAAPSVSRVLAGETETPGDDENQRKPA